MLHPFQQWSTEHTSNSFAEFLSAESPFAMSFIGDSRCMYIMIWACKSKPEYWIVCLKNWERLFLLHFVDKKVFLEALLSSFGLATPVWETRDTWAMETKEGRCAFPNLKIRSSDWGPVGGTCALCNHAKGPFLRFLTGRIYLSRYKKQQTASEKHSTSFQQAWEFKT